jgi:hypothetical protein
LENLGKVQIATVISAGILAARGIRLESIVGGRVIDHPALQI